MPQGTGIIELGERSIRKFFEHRMSTYAAALAYRGLFGLFPFVLILVVLAGAPGLPSYFYRMIEEARSETSPQMPQQMGAVGGKGGGQNQPLTGMIEQGEGRGGGEFL